MDYPKPGRLVGGIILAAIGVIGLGGMGTTDVNSVAAYIIVCLLFMGGGLALILAYVRARKRYSAYQREEDERMQREQDLYDARKELELQKVNAELERVKAAAEQVRVCPHCGGSTKGEICEYCGSRL